MVTIARLCKLEYLGDRLTQTTCNQFFVVGSKLGHLMFGGVSLPDCYSYFWQITSRLVIEIEIYFKIEFLHLGNQWQALGINKAKESFRLSTGFFVTSLGELSPAHYRRTWQGKIAKHSYEKIAKFPGNPGIEIYRKFCFDLRCAVGFQNCKKYKCNFPQIATGHN